MGRLSYAVSEIRDNYDDREWWRTRIKQRLNAPVQQRLRPRSEGVDVLDAEWSTLVVVDACRLDLFESVAAREETDERFADPEAVTSVASSTPEWLATTFGESHGDIVYVAGNPMVSRHCAGTFYELIEAWEEGYDPETSVVSPELVTGRAIEARDAYPEKRLIVHYMQPHYPFVDRPELQFFDGFVERREVSDVWQALRHGLVEEPAVWEGYEHNLSVVLDEITRYLDAVDDRVVVTSDHGNVLGRRAWPVPLRTYGHPANYRLPGLVRVPWVVRDGERRPTTDGRVAVDDTDEEIIDDRLSNLGYV